ncbi:MAG: hypothetical protein Q8O01_01860 [Candidatus Omnitrophota bacterium]|nr:hypothetical protein [Candidatus Omnitrophota bacterium]
MIRIDIASLVFFYILFSVIAIFVIWVVLGYKRVKSISEFGNDTEFTWECSICLHSYVDSLHDDISVCPFCSSYNKRLSAKP